MITSREEGDALPEALQAGASDFISKPVHRQVLLARVNNLLESITAQKNLIKASETQRVICEAMPDPMALANVNGEIQFVNDGLIGVCLGLKPKTIEQLFASIYGGEIFEGTLKLVSRSQSSTEEEIVEEFKINSKTPRIIQIFSRATSSEGLSDSRIWIFRDVTAAREMAKRAEDKLRLESVRMLVSGIAHNYNNILGGIIGAVEVLERNSDNNERMKRAVRVVRVGAESAAKLTRKMDIFTRPDLGEENLNSESVESILETVNLMMQERVGDRISFSVKNGVAVPPVAMTLISLLEVFNNIFSNAVEAIDGIGKIETTLDYDDAMKRVVVKVSDNGCGINDSDQERIFEPFFTTKNLDADHAVGIDGKGLGLWNVYNILRLSGGDIEIDSKQGKGTEVTLFLPSASDELLDA